MKTFKPKNVGTFEKNKKKRKKNKKELFNTLKKKSQRKLEHSQEEYIYIYIARI